MLLPIDSSEYDSQLPFTHEAISYAMEIQMRLNIHEDPNLFIVASYFLSRVLKQSLSVEVILNTPIFPDEENKDSPSLFNVENTDSDIIEIGKKYINNDSWKSLIEEFNTIPHFFDYTSNFKKKNLMILKRVASFKYKKSFDKNKENAVTPECIINLVKKILNISQSDNVADVCCGDGTFLDSVLKDQTDIIQDDYKSAILSDALLKSLKESLMDTIKDTIKETIKEYSSQTEFYSEKNPITPRVYAGYEINPTSLGILKIKKELLSNSNLSLEIFKGDVFENQSEDIKYNKIFSHYPFFCFINNENTKEYVEKLQDIPIKDNRDSYDWAYYNLIYNMLDKNDGKAVIIVPYGNSVNGSCSNIRKYFVENNMIEAVIKLPDGLFYETGATISLLVLSTNKKNDSIKLIDATNMFTNTKARRTLIDDDIEAIVSVYEGNQSISTKGSKTCIFVEISNEEVITGKKSSAMDSEAKSELVRQKEESVYSVKLNASDYLSESLSVFSKETPIVPLGSLIKGISRGSHCKAKELEDMTTNQETNVNYVLLNNIQDGLIDKNLPYLNMSENDLKRFKKYFLEADDLIMSKTGPNYKFALSHYDSNTHVLATGNMYIIKLDKKKVAPKYLLAYLLSKPGQRSLNSLSKGSVIPTISMTDVLDLEIPLPSKEIQAEFAKKSFDILSNINRLKKELEEARNAHDNLFGESFKDKFEDN